MWSKSSLLIMVLVACILLPERITYAQTDFVPQDYLPAAFHAERRAALREKMPENTVAVFFANPVRNRSNDVDYVYHQDPDFYYLTGYKEPDAVLLVFSATEKIGNQSCNEVLFVRKKDPDSEMWTGRRLGVEGAKEQLGFSCVFTAEAFSELVDFNQFEQILFLDFQNDVRDTSEPADLFDLIGMFKDKTAYPNDFQPTKFRLYGMVKATEVKNSANVAQVIGRYMEYYPELKIDKLLREYITAQTDEERAKVAKNMPGSKLDVYSLGYLMNSLREIKLPQELRLLRKAVSISAVGQVEVMKAMHPKMSELEIQGIHEFVYKRYGAENVGYPSIVGAGGNGCILHYIDNTKPKVGNELVLMDLGAEYRGYTADVTRTIPANGTFSPEQKAIYQLVYEAQEAAFAVCKPGSEFSAPHMAAAETIDKGLVALGIIKSISEEHNYFPHGTSHYLGLDVHDRGNYGELMPNMVITVEPGIYIPEGSPCDKKWWGIAVRIEDDVLITKDGYENLSAFAPRTIEAIEAMMAQKSVLENWILPALD